MKKILYGICGIGNGHLYRQLPILQYLLSKKYQVLVFGYGNSFDYIKNYIKENQNILDNLLDVVEVNVPYYIGNNQGIDFVKSANINSSTNHLINLQAFAKAQRWLGKPDLVISDYEPFSAQYGYSHNTKVVTIDQQSKYLVDYLPQPLDETCYIDEAMRLRMFFPIAEKRLVASFFKINNYKNNDNIFILPPLIRKEVLNIKNVPDYQKKDYIVYISAQEGYEQSLSNLLNVLSSNEHIGCFHVFLKKSQYVEAINLLKQLPDNKSNIKVYQHGSKDFEKLLTHSLGIITTAGHTLISEAMHLMIPVYAIPMNLYEQKLSAKIIHENQFGQKCEVVTSKELITFSNGIIKYRNNIINDKEVLFKENGLSLLINELNLLL